jgi:hypothetical protein
MSIVGVKKKLRRLSSVGSHDSTKAAGISSGGLSLYAVVVLINREAGLRFGAGV